MKLIKFLAVFVCAIYSSVALATEPFPEIDPCELEPLQIIGTYKVEPSASGSDGIYIDAWFGASDACPDRVRQADVFQVRIENPKFAREDAKMWAVYIDSDGVPNVTYRLPLRFTGITAPLPLGTAAKESFAAGNPLQIVIRAGTGYGVQGRAFTVYREYQD